MPGGSLSYTYSGIMSNIIPSSVQQPVARAEAGN